MRHHRLLSVVCVVLILAGFAVHTNAQTPACPDIVKQALALTSAKCSQIGRNQACFGNPLIKAEAKPNLPDPSKFVFANPGDTVNLADLQSLQMGEMNTQDQTWGVAYMRAQANLPDTAAGQYVTMLMFGNVQITDKSQDSNGTEKPMQAFYFRTGVGASACENIPTSGLVLQSPKGSQKVELTVNEVKMKIGSTVYLEAPDDTLNSITHNEVDATQPATPRSTIPPTNTPANGPATQGGPHHWFKITTIQGSVDITYNGHTTTVKTGQQSTVPLNDNNQPEGTPAPPTNVSDLPQQDQSQLNIVNNVVNANLIQQPPTDEPSDQSGDNPTATNVPADTEIPVSLLPTDTPVPPPTATNVPPTATVPPPPPPPPPPPATNTPKPTFTQTPTPSTIAVNSGSPQSVTINTAFAPFSVIVKGTGNLPISGVNVTFTAPNSGASGTFPGASLSVAVQTDANGIATAPTFTANGKAGSYSVSAVIGSLNTSIALTNAPDAPASITATGGSGQHATVHTAFATPLTALVKDSSNNPVPGVSVTFDALGSEANGTFSGSATVTTDANGIATAPTLTANATAGSYSVTASAAGVGTPTEYGLTNDPGPASSIVVNVGAGQSAEINTAFPNALSVVVMDADGNWIPGASVTFVAPGSGASGTFGGSATVTTDGSGIATAPTFTANGTTGPYKVTASTPGVGTDAIFALSNTVGPATSIAVNGGSGQSAQINTAFATAMSAIVKDAHNNPVPGASVTFAAPGSGASGAFGSSATVTTDGSGIATAPTFTANSSVGSYSVTASTSGVGANASFSLTNTVGAPASIAVNGGDGQTTQAGTAFATTLSAIVKDSGGNPVPNISVTFNAPDNANFSGSASAMANTNGSGIATAPTLTTICPPGALNITASVSGVGTNADFSETSTASTVVSNLNDSGAGSLRQTIANACAGSTITFSAGGTITLTSGEITINKALTISGTAGLTISGNNASRIFNITSGPVTLDQMIITAGSASAGGAVVTTADLTITNVTFSNNHSAGGAGALYSSPAGNPTLTISNSSFTGNNSGSNAGGGLQANGTTTITNTSFTGNTGSNGGGLSNRQGSMTIDGGTFTGNTGYGLENQSTGSLNLKNSTLNTNSPANCTGTINNGGSNIDSPTGTCGD